MSTVEDESQVECEEEMGYDVPFVTYTWERWQQMQVQAFLSFTRFQRAIEQRQPQQAHAIALELQEIGVALQKEVGQWIMMLKK